MAQYAVFLRGVNVGGITVRSADLRATLESLPVDGVKTLLASGNAVLSSSLSRAQVKARIEEALRKDFGYDAWVVVLSRREIDDLVAGCPYPPDNPEVHSYLTLASDPSALDELWESTADGGTERVRLAPLALAWQSPKGATLDSPLSKATAKPKFKSTTTTRNLRTLLKVQAAFGD